MTDKLPIHDVLGVLKQALAEQSTAVLVAPPGAGKTTVVPLALMDEPWTGGGRLIVLEPRRLAARAAARRMARTLNEPAGERVGFRVRMQSKISARTQVEVVTEGIFTRMILDDPGLLGVAAVLFDEFHERSLDADLGLALAREAQQLLRPDLRLLVMSATLDGARVSALLGDAPIIESHGRAWPVETRYVDRAPSLRLEDQVARVVRRALADESGGILVVLPGQAEIRRVQERLAEELRDPAVIVAPLYGALQPAEQDRAVEPPPAGFRKVVLATSIAETSLTIEGVRVVIDSGLARTPRYDPGGGLTRLETVRVSQAAADQRRGRAGRTQPGVCYRLWSEPETRSLPAFARAEILESDLARLALDLAIWGAKDPAGLAFLDPPPAAAMAEARAFLQRIDALDSKGALTAHGRRVARLPLPPRLAHMVVRGADHGEADTAALIAALVSERGLGGDDPDLRWRLDRVRRDGSPRVRDARTLAARWAKLAGEGSGFAEPVGEARLLAFAYPERVAHARGKPGEFRLANGRGVFLDPAHALARATWLSVGELGGGAARDRVLLAAALDPARIAHDLAEQIESEAIVETDSAGRVKVKRVSRLGRLIVEERLAPADPALIRRALLDRVRVEGLAALPENPSLSRLLARVGFLRTLDPRSWPDLSEPALIARRAEWLEPLLHGHSSLAGLAPQTITDSVSTLLPWDLQSRLNREAPERFEAPTGARHQIDYAAEGGPRVEVRVQELFGLVEHPMVANGRVPLTVALLSPAHRPVQTTRDLPGFWRGSYAAVRTEMRGRYPRHPWPEDPLAAAPTTRAKPRGS